MISETLENALESAVLKALDFAEKTGEFVIDAAPGLIQEFIAWKTMHHIASIIMCIVIFLVIKYAPCLFFKKQEKAGYEEASYFGYVGHEIPVIIFYIILGCWSLFAVIEIACSIMNLIKIIYAPNIYLMEYFLG